MTQKLGKLGEQTVIDHLILQKFKILAHNYQKFFGEIDIIAQKNDLIVFVEVKTRKNSFLTLHNLVSHSKQQKIIKTARFFISSHTSSLQNKTFRFDVALLHLQDNMKPELTYIPNAFDSQNY
jgi:putative endonuclease